MYRDLRPDRAAFGLFHLARGDAANRLIVAAAAALVLIFRWQISMMIYQFVASIFSLIALFVGVVLLCALPFVLIRLFLH